MEPCSDNSIADRLPFNKCGCVCVDTSNNCCAVLLLRIRATPFACAFSLPGKQYCKAISCLLPSCASPSTFTDTKDVQVISYHLFRNLCRLTSFKHCADVPCCKSYHRFGPKKTPPWALSFPRYGFPLGAVILPSSGDWLGISVEPCGLEFIVAVSVTWQFLRGGVVGPTSEPPTWRTSGFL